MGFLDPKPLTVAAGNATYVPKWKPNTAYLAGDAVLSPAGDTVTAKANFTSGASYNTANWNISATYASREAVGPYKAVPADQMQYISGSGAFAGLRAFLDGGAGSAAIQVMGDSTGGVDTTNKDHWVWNLTQWLAANYPALTVRYRVWEMGGAPTKYISAETVQTGSAGWCSYTLSGAANTTLYLGNTDVPNFTGDTDVALKVDVPVWPPTAIGALASKTGGSGNFGWQFYLQADGKLLWQWSSSGTNTLAALSTAAVTLTPNVPVYLRATQDVDNTAGGNTVTFYTSTDGTTWTQLGSPVVSAFVTSHYASTVNVQLGGTNGAFTGSNLFKGRIYEAWIRDGINGPTIAPVNALDWLPGPAAVANIGWVLDIVNGSWAGKTVNDLNSKYAQMTPDLGTVLTILNDGHNDTNWLGPFYTDMLNTWKTNVMSRLKRTGLAVTNQNPEVSPATYRRAHGARQGLLAAWASRNGATIINVYKAFLDDPRYDGTNTGALYNVDATGIHPSPTGWALWADIVKRAVKLGS